MLDLKVAALGGFIETEIEDALNINGFETPAFLTIAIGR